MNLKFLLIALFSISLTFAQEKGTVTGIVTDKDMNNESLPFASVSVKGMQLNTATDDNGNYTISVPPGSHTIVFAFLGYESVEVPFTIAAGETKTINQALGSTSVQLADIVIEKVVSREKESALLLEQKNAVVIKQSIGAQELTRKGVSDAAAAVTKVTGISKTEGNSGIFVRGLGDRYNSTLLNGLPLPSNEPENKNIALDLFSTDIIQSVGISKTFSTDLYGDMGGANVDILSKEHTGSGKLIIEAGSGLNNKAFGSDFRIADNVEKSGFYDINTPTSITDYQFGSKWVPGHESKPVNGNFGISGGKSFDVGETGRLSGFFTANYGNGYTYRNGSQKIVSNRNDNVIVDYFNVDKYEFSTKTTLMANIAYKFNPDNTIKANSIFVNASKSTVGEYDTFIGQGDNRNEFTRQTLTEQNKLFVNQLLGKHNLTNRLSLDWGGSFSTVNADLPDRITNNLILTGDNYTFNTASPTVNNRYFQYIDEKEYAAKALFSYKIMPGENDDYSGKLTFGYNGRLKSRDFKATQFNFRINADSTNVITPNNIDNFLNRDNQSLVQNVANSFYVLTSRLQSLIPFTYNGDLSIHSGIANFEHSPTDNITYTVGVRAEKVLQELVWDTNFPIAGATFDDATIDDTYILPAATLKLSLNDNQNLRFAASKTYTLPQFKEKAPFRYEGVGENSVGNPLLNSSDNYNLDIKWENFPKNDELISVGAFGKYINNPISQVLLNSTLNDNTYVNAGRYAYVAGAEFEIRKTLWSLDNETTTQAFTGGLNFTVMYSEQELDSDKVARDTKQTISVNFNEDKDQLQGASPLLINADITYRKETGTFRPTLSLVGNYFHDRIYSLGSFERGNIVEKGIMMLNFVSNANIGERLNISFNAENILNSRIRRVQENQEGDITTFNYRAGVDFTLGLKYNIF